MTRLVIVMDGGCIQNLLADGELDIAVIDYDRESYDLDKLTDIPQMSEGKPDGTEQAYAYKTTPYEIDPAEVEKLWQAI